MKNSNALSRNVWIALIAIIIIVIAGIAAVWYLTQPRPFTVYSLWADTEEENFLQALERFTENTGIEVRHVSQSTEELLITVPTQLQAGEAVADVVIAPWPSWILNLAENDYPIRKLNQAYFAFHGAYADKPTSISPIGDELKKLRQRSESLKDFLETVAAMTSRQDLAESVK